MEPPDSIEGDGFGRLRVLPRPIRHGCCKRAASSSRRPPSSNSSSKSSNHTTAGSSIRPAVPVACSSSPLTSWNGTRAMPAKRSRSTARKRPVRPSGEEDEPGGPRPRRRHPRGEHLLRGPYDSVGKFDFVMANPPFNVSKVDKSKLEDDRRFSLGLPTTDNANYLWIQHFYSALSEEGRAGFVMANSASDASGSELEIRRQLVETRSVDVVVAVGTNIIYTVILPVTRGSSTGQNLPTGSIRCSSSTPERSTTRSIGHIETGPTIRSSFSPTSSASPPGGCRDQFRCLLGHARGELSQWRVPRCAGTV